MNPQNSSAPKIYRCGTLTYTKRHLVILFFWLIWGDVCYTLMEGVLPSIMPLKFKELGASGLEMGLILGTVPSLVYSVLNPIISFKSDRFRSRFGRRMPFIILSLPILVAGLTVLGFGDKLGFWLHSHLGETISHLSPATFAIWFIGIIMVIFTFFNTFVTSTFWYLFNDVVPEHLLARFMSWFRIVGLLSVSFYSFLIFPHSTTHYTAIMIGAAALYLIGFGLMCCFVREGEYPPPAPYVGGRHGPLAAMETYFKESLTIKHYWFQWSASITGAISGSMVTFMVFFYLTVGLSMQQIGILNGCIGFVTAIMVLGTGWLADRYHPIRVVIGASILGTLIIAPLNVGVWIFLRPAPEYAFLVVMLITMGLTVPCQAGWAMGDPPLLMRLFPRSNYGQFCSVNALWRACGAIIGGLAAGGFLDLIGKLVGKEEAYRYIPLWNLFFTIPGLYFNILLYRSWKKLGGDENYIPPVIKPEDKP
jgi:MFS family permease